ncbi:MAG: fibronectin type III domain-containing protein [Patescibacteria group bacterium]|nr:fibronectin type III domain-containing protein [Patescibacteria group bacterium]
MKTKRKRREVKKLFLLKITSKFVRVFAWPKILSRYSVRNIFSPHFNQKSRKRQSIIATIGVFLFLLLTVGAFLGWRIFWASATSDTITFNTQAIWEAGEYYPGTIDTKSTADSMKIQSGYVGDWDKGTPGFYTDLAGYDYWSYDGASYGADFTTDGTYIYLIVGNRRPYLIRYNPETNSWKQLASAPTTFYYGGSITYDASTKSIFAIDGGEQNETGNATKHMYQYDLATDAWSRVTDAPDPWGLGSSIAADGAGTIYAVRGRSTDTLWSYDIASDEWDVTLPALPTPYYVYTTNGQPLEFVNEPYSDVNGDHCASGCLFTLYGNNNRQFFRYDIAERQWYYNSPTDLTIPSALGGVGYGSSFAYDSTNGNLYLLHGNQTDDFSKYDVSASDWDDAAADTPDAPGVVYNGGALVYLDGYIYAFKGYGVPDIWRFKVDDPGGNAWESISTPLAVGNDENGMMTFVPNGSYCADATGCLFVLRGANINPASADTFWRYNIGARTWSTLSDTNTTTSQNPTSYFRQGTSTCWNGADYIYALKANNVTNGSNTEFYRYTISTDTWSNSVNGLPLNHSGPGDYPSGNRTAHYGASLACLGANVYAIKGGSDANGSNHFFKFDGTNWSSLTVVPQRTYVGGALVSVPNGVDCADATGCVFALMGNQRGDFYRYDTTAGTWTSRASLPTATNYTAALSYDASGQIYATSGDYDTRMWRYDITTNTWTRVADLPARVGYNNALAYDATAGTMYLQMGMSTNSIWRFTPSNNNYISSATWISATQDLDYVNAWEQLTATNPTPGSSSISFALRSSTDKVTWSDWETVVNAETGDTTTQSLSSITTPARRYIQIKITLTSDGTNTPTLSDLAVTYTKDGTAPTNPTISGYSDSTETTGLTSDNSYYYTNPYFKLEDAADAHSGIAGYYVRWSDDDEDDPAASEDYYQTGATYVVNTELTPNGTYYLLVKTKDNAGNVSSSSTSFTYIYSGILITDETRQTWTAEADFEAAGTDESNINTEAGTGTAMTLDSVSPGTWMDLPATYGVSPDNLTAYRDTSMTYDGDNTIYVLRAENSKKFYSYTISSKTWTNLADITSTNVAWYGAVIEYVSGAANCRDNESDVTGTTKCVYALPGSSVNPPVGDTSKEFLRYDIDGTDANSWTSRAAISGVLLYGADLVWAGGDYLYAERGYNQSNFYRYSISTNTWADRATPDNAFYYGSTLAYVPNGTYCGDSQGCIFATRGAGSDHFWRYDINANSWSYLTAPPNASSSKGNYGATSLYYDGYIYLSGGYAATDFMKYDILTDTWTLLADLPATHYFGSTNGLIYHGDTDTIYMLRGYNEYSFFSYDVVNDKWRNPTLPHGMSSNGFSYGGLTYDDSDTLYVARGGNNNDFYKYTISTQIWTRLADVPMRMYYTSDLIYVDGYVYALTGIPPYAEGVTKFYRYDPTTDLWTRLDDTPSTVGYGTKLIYDGDHTIYTARGAGTATYYSYDLDDPGWSTQASAVPGTLTNGACAVMTEISDVKYIYQIRSSNTLDVYRCTLDTEAGTCTWTAQGQPGDPTDAPAGAGSINLYYGAACTVSGGNIFVPRGNTNNLDFLVYNISGDSWASRSLNSFYYDGRLVTGPGDILYGFRGYNTSSLERYVQQTDTTSFERVGTWTSQIIDSGTIYDFGGLTANDTAPDNTALKYETRTCSDAGCADDVDDEHWSDWDEVSNEKTVGSTDYYTLDSTPAQYVQLKITFTSDRIYTPTVNDITLSYYADGTAPDNPDTLTAKSQASGGVDIESGDWNNYTTPYFSWSGAADNTGGIGIQGYCVYFGTNSEADPADGCTPQTAATYTSSSLSTGETYYLRIKTKDYLGNTSAETWAPFTYSLDSVAPSRPTNLASSPAVPSAANSFNIFWTAGSDSGGSPSFQHCYKRYFSDEIQDESDTCIPSTETSLLGIEALVEGVNYFKIRTLDEAGNYSNGGEYESVAYRWAQTPPSLPLNVEHGEVEGDDYSHTFAWSEPAEHAFDIGAYCYQINEIPTASYCNNSTYGRWTTTVETAGKFLAAFRTPNTQPGTNTFYVVAKDEAGLVDWDTESFDCANGLGCIEFESNTISPNAPQSFSLVDASNRDAQSYRLTLGWKKPADNPGSVLYKYNVYRSTDGVEYTLRESLLHVDGQDEYAYTDVSLTSTVTYYYKVTASDLAGAESDYTSAISMKPEGKYTIPPDLVGAPSIQPRIRSALIEWLTEPSTHPASSFVRYGLTEEYELGEQGSSDLVSSHSVTLIDLEPATTYHFELKWLDRDGNIGSSPDYEFTTNDAPSAPINLTVDPASNTVNRYTFDWDPPADEGVTISGYFYSVNNVPTVDNVKFVTDSQVGPIAAATQQGVNTLYVVAVDDAGNVNYANYISVEFEVHTAAPGEPQNVTIIDSSDRNAERYNITLTWDPPATASTEDENEIYYSIYRSEDGGISFSNIARLTSTGYLDTGLNNTVKYYYKITASDKAGASSESTDPVAEIPEGRYTAPPAITELPIALADSYTAVITWRTEREASSFVDFGITSKEWAEEQGTAQLIEAHSVKITGLKPETKYYYQVKSIDIDENVAYSEVYSFVTLEAPRVSEVAITDVRLFDAIISWKTNKETTTSLDYGTTTKYGTTYTDVGGSFTFTHTIKLEKLTDATTYHLRMAGQDSNNNPVQSDDYSFTTLTFPKVSDIRFQNKAEGETEVTWKTNVPTTSNVEYYNPDIPSKTQGNTALVTEHSVLLFGLEDATLYSTKVRGTDQFGYEAVSDVLTFTTLEDTTPPIISNVQSESNTVGAGDASKVQIIISWRTNEPTTSKVEYGEGLGDTAYSGETDENAELVFEHLVVVSNLSPARTYHFRVVSNDKAGNESKSGSYSVLTSRKRESFLQLVVSQLETTFSWLGNMGNIFK